MVHLGPSYHFIITLNILLNNFDHGPSYHFIVTINILLNTWMVPMHLYSSHFYSAWQLRKGKRKQRRNYANIDQLDLVQMVLDKMWWMIKYNGEKQQTNIDQCLQCVNAKRNFHQTFFLYIYNNNIVYNCKIVIRRWLYTDGDSILVIW